MLIVSGYVRVGGHFGYSVARFGECHSFAYLRTDIRPYRYPTQVTLCPPLRIRSRRPRVRRTDPDRSQHLAKMCAKYPGHFRDCLNNYVKEGRGDNK